MDRGRGVTPLNRVSEVCIQTIGDLKLKTRIKISSSER